MDSNGSPAHSTGEVLTECVSQPENNGSPSGRVNSCEETEADDSLHAFNLSNVTVIERRQSTTGNSTRLEEIVGSVSQPPCEGSDSGVEVLEANDGFTCHRALSSLTINSNNSGTSHELDSFTCAPCDSPTNNCSSNYEEAYNILVRRNSRLFENYSLRNDEHTSENGSESSSIAGCSTSAPRRTNLTKAKNKPAVSENKKTPVTSRSKGTAAASTNASARVKPCDRPQSTPNRTRPNSAKKPACCMLDLTKKEPRKGATPRTSSTTRTPAVTPSDDGRWPSVNSKPAPLLSKSLRNTLETTRVKLGQMETKTIEKYATLPRPRKEKAKSESNVSKKMSREQSINRLAFPKNLICKEHITNKPSISNIKRKVQRVKIFHECNTQTLLTMEDVQKALAGMPVRVNTPDNIQQCDKSEQADVNCAALKQLQAQHDQLTQKYEALLASNQSQLDKLTQAEGKLHEVKVEKEGLEEELRRNSQIVQSLLGETSEETASTDSLLMLESRYKNVSQIVMRQEDEISKLSAMCRSLKIDLEKSLFIQRTVSQQHQELEAETAELQEFMQAEKTTLSDALREAENEIARQSAMVEVKNNEVQDKMEECKRVTRLNEQAWRDNLELQTKLRVLEAKYQDFLVHQGSSISGTSVALSALIGRLDGLTDELVTSYSISDQELEDVIYHNEVYNNSSSSSDTTPEKSKALVGDNNESPKKGSSFVSAVINAIKNAAAQNSFSELKEDKESLTKDRSNSNEMLDYETEPCLMMEHVLEDVVIPDGYTHNMISSCHSFFTPPHLSDSDSFRPTVLFRQSSERPSQMHSLNASFSGDTSSLCDIFPTFSMVDQVIEVDNLVTRLLKVIRIIQLETDDCMNELTEQRDGLMERVTKQLQNQNHVAKQLKDWELLGARLKTEVKELLSRLSKKNADLDKIKTEMNQQREQIEKLNQDVCELSTALAKKELSSKLKYEEVAEAVKSWQEGGEIPSLEVMGHLVWSQNEVVTLEAKLADKEKHLGELTREFLANRQLLSESLRKAASEAKRQYEAIDNALQVLHENQNTVQQCPPLADLQRDLENISFQSASVMPLITPSDFNANAAILQVISNLQLTSPINSAA